MATLEELRSGALEGSLEVRLSCGLTEFPKELLTLADTLEILDLSRNLLTDLPEDFAQLQKLRIFFCSENQLEHVPEVLGKCPALTMIGLKSNRIHTCSSNALPKQLRWLILTDNRLESLPDDLGTRPLQKLMLAGNRLRTLPPSLEHCPSLELLRISANQLESMPVGLLSLPRLSWLAWGGNPASPVIAPPQLPHWNWQDLEIGDHLGQGASGTIFAARPHTPPADMWTLAVKVFKGEVTSDGYPQDEYAATARAGQHPGLIPVLGALHNHPEGRNGLVMQRISSNHITLGLPPSLDSCTRDIFKSDLILSQEHALQIAKDVASIGAHIHEQGILHGDLYAHNLLLSPNGNALLGDFGAASCHSPTTPLATSLEQIEMRAYGCLLDDVLGLCPTLASSPIEQLRDACWNPTASQRPLFKDCSRQLAAF